MTVFIIAIGCLLVVAGIAITVKPALLFDPLRQHMESRVTYGLAIGVRLLLGILLVALAAQSRFPTAVALLGWLSIAAALTFAAVGQQRFVRMVSWILLRTEQYTRIAGLLAVAIGGFLVYSFIG